MRSEAPALLPIFRSQRQAALLAELFHGPERELSLTALAKRLDVSTGALHADVERLIGADLILDRRVGRTRLLRANRSTRAAQALSQLLLVTFGPEHVVRDEFAQIPAVSAVYIYGSWARRYNGEFGPEPGDVDVMVVGTPDRDMVFDAADRASERIGFPVNAVVRSESAWSQADDALVVTAKGDAVLIVNKEAIG